MSIDFTYHNIYEGWVYGIEKSDEDIQESLYLGPKDALTTFHDVWTETWGRWFFRIVLHDHSTLCPPLSSLNDRFSILYTASALIPMQNVACISPLGLSIANNNPCGFRVRRPSQSMPRQQALVSVYISVSSTGPPCDVSWWCARIPCFRTSSICLLTIFLGVLPFYIFSSSAWSPLQGFHSVSDANNALLFHNSTSLYRHLAISLSLGISHNNSTSIVLLPSYIHCNYCRNMLWIWPLVCSLHQSQDLFSWLTHLARHTISR